MAAKSKQYSKLLLCVLGIFLFSCEKMDESGFLDNPYHKVADVKQYCQGACEESYDWENHQIGIEGHIPDIENDNTLQDYKAESHFYLADIRNGMIIDIKIQDGINDIFDTLFKLQKTDKFFIQGVARAISATDGKKCEKGVFIDLYGLGNLKVNKQ